ncbi:MAG: AI-2E family transporter [Burkholderiales bacterium]
MIFPGSDNSRLYFVLGAALVVGLLFYALGPILTPFMAAAILAYICDPFADRLQAKGVPRTLATALVLLLLITIFVVLLLITIPLFQKEIALLAQRLPSYLTAANEKLIPWLNAKLGLKLELDFSSLRDSVTAYVQDAQGLAGKVFSSLRIGGLAVIGFFINLLLIPVVLFYLLRDWEKLVEKIDHLIPRRWHGKVTEIAKEIDAVLSEFLRGQISVMLLMSVFYVVGLWFAGLEFALPVGIITGMLVFVPYVGMITGLLLATLAALMQFQEWTSIVWVWAVFGVGQLLEGMVVTPWLVGDRIGLHPVVVIFALLAFGQIFGFFGVLLALPVSAVLLVALRHVRQNYLNSRIYNE